MTAYFSTLDSDRFGYRIARAKIYTSEDLNESEKFCVDNNIDMLIARCPTTNLNIVQDMERCKFLLMDTLLYCKKDLNNIYDVKRLECLKTASATDTDIVKSIAARSFKSYGGHFYADERLDREKCDAGYADWAGRSCLNISDTAIVKLFSDDDIKGFVMVQVNDETTGEVPLYAVSPEYQGQGIGKVLISGALLWCKEHGLNKMVISTQITNVSSQKVWARLGFEIDHSYYTFHKWYV